MRQVIPSRTTCLSLRTFRPKLYAPSFQLNDRLHSRSSSTIPSTNSNSEEELSPFSKSFKSQKLYRIKRFIFSFTSPESIFTKVISRLIGKSLEAPDVTYDPKVLAEFMTRLKLTFNPIQIMPVDKDDIHQPGYVTEAMKIISSEYGNGIAIDKDRFIHLIRGANKGDTVIAQVQASVMGLCRSKLINVLKINQSEPEKREIPKCKHYYECNGCQFQHIPYQLELWAKRKYVLDLLVNTFRSPENRDKFHDARIVKNLAKSAVFPKHHTYGYEDELCLKLPNLRDGEAISRVELDIETPPFMKEIQSSLDIEKCELVNPTLQDALVNFRQHWIGKTYLASMNSDRSQLEYRTSHVLPPNKSMSEFVDEVKLAYQLKRNTSTPLPPDFDESVTQPEEEPMERYKTIAVPRNENILCKVVDRVYEISGQWPLSYSANTLVHIGNYLASRISFFRKSSVARAKFNIRYFIVPNAGYGFYPIQLGRLFERVVGLASCNDSLHACQHNVRLNNLEDQNISFHLFNPTHAYDLGRIAAKSCIDSKFTMAIWDPPKEGYDFQLLRNMVQFGPKIILFVCNDLETQIHDLLYFVTGRAKSREVGYFSEIPDITYKRTVVLIKREIQRQLEQGIDVSMSTESLKKILPPYLWEQREFDAIGVEAKEIMQHNVFSSQSHDTEEKKYFLPSFCNPGSSYRISSMRVLDTHPRTKRMTTVFVLNRL